MDEAIPSGPWYGFYTYRTRTERHRMDLRLDFKEGRISGDGIDDIGRFGITGSYENESLKCRFRKNYFGAHTVIYEGAWDLGSIWGLWTIPPWSKGGFRIWPGARGEGIALEAYEDLPEEVPHESPAELAAPRRLSR